MSEGIGQHSPAPPIIPQTQPHLPYAETASRLNMVPPRIITPASTAAPSSSSSSASASKPTTTTSSTAAAARTMASARDLSPHSHERRKSRSPRRHAAAAAATSSSSTSPPDRLAGLSSQRQLRQLERLAIQQSQTRQRTQHTSISPVAAGKRPAFNDHDDAAPGVAAPDAKLSITGASSSQQSAVGGANISPSTYKTRRGRSANVSPSRRWDRRGASATVLSGASASGSGSGEESEITVGPSHQRRLAGASTNRSSLPRTGTSTRRSRGRGGSSAKMSPDIAAQQDDEGTDGLTSSDEEGALASRYARSRRASLERDRLRGMQILMSATGSKSGGTSHEDLLNLASYDVATSASTSTSATPTTMTDDCSERSSMLSRTSSLEGSPVTSPIVAPAHVLPSNNHHNSRRKSRSRLNSTEAGSPAFFGLADDEEEAALSASALSAALAARPRSRGKSPNHSSASPSPDKVRSVPSSRRPSAPESSTLGPATSSSVPNRASAILGFAPVSSSSSAAARFASLPRSNSRRQAMMLSLSRSLGGSSNGNVNGGDEIDLLSGSSIGSVEDLIQVDQVEWAPDADDGGKTSKALKGRRGSLIGVRTDEAQRTGTGDATVAALEAKSLMGSSESEAEPGSSSSVTTQSTSSRRTLPLLPKTPTAANSPLSSTSSSSPSKSQEQAPQAGFAVAYQERLSNLQSQLRLWASEANDVNGQAASAEQQQQQQQQAGLLASSWRQIARLPNLLFPATKADKGAAASAVSSRSPSPSLADASSSASATPITSTPDSSGITLTGGVSSPADAVPTNTRRRPSVGSRGVVDPLEGDRDPGAYVTGLGHRIDPDVELSSVVHLQSFRSRGRSVDARRPASSSAPRSSHHAAHGERRTASDTEQSPALLSTKEGSMGSGSWEDATTHSSVLPALDLPPAVKPLTRAKPQFTLHDDEDEHESQGSTAPAASAVARPSAPAPVPQHSKPAAQVDEDGFTKVVGRNASSSSPRCSRPAAEAPVPMDWTAYGNGGNSTSSEESDADLSRSTTATVESTDDTRRHTIGRRSRPTGDGEDGGAEEDDDDDDDGRLAPARGRRGRGRGKGARVSSRANSPDAALSRNRQCAIGLFSSKPGSRRQDNSSDEYAAAAMKTVRSSPDLTYTGAAALGRGMSSTTDTRSRSRNKTGGGGPQRPSRSRTTSSSSLKGGRDAPVNEDSSSSSSDDGGRGRGRGRAGSVKVTSSSFAASEHPPNSLPRSASASNLETMARRQSMMSAAALSTGTSGGPPPMPMSSAQHHQQPAPPATTAHGGLMSSWAYGGAKGTASSSATGRSLSAPNASSMSKSSASDAASSSSSASSLNGGNDTQQPLPLAPARPTLLSNSAHLLMLSLELEMMRAQKISAPLKVRWARQRAATAPPSPQMGGRAALQPAAVEKEHQAVMASADEAALEAAATDGPAPDLVCASSSDESEEAEDASQATVMVAPALHRYAFQPRQASKLRHVING